MTALRPHVGRRDHLCKLLKADISSKALKVLVAPTRTSDILDLYYTDDDTPADNSPAFICGRFLESAKRCEANPGVCQC